MKTSRQTRIAIVSLILAFALMGCSDGGPGNPASPDGTDHNSNDFGDLEGPGFALTVDGIDYVWGPEDDTTLLKAFGWYTVGAGIFTWGAPVAIDLQFPTEGSVFSAANSLNFTVYMGQESYYDATGWIDVSESSDDFIRGRFQGTAQNPTGQTISISGCFELER